MPLDQSDGPDEKDVKIVCAWCNDVLKNPEGHFVSHGICRPCYAKHLGEEMIVEVVDNDRARVSS